MDSDFRKGINLGGWLSQYQEFSQDHFRSFIQHDDLKQIRDWGFDHIRLPVDYPVMLDLDNPEPYREEGFAHIDRCFEWCEREGLNLVFDLHHAPGFTFNNALRPETMHLNTLFVDPDSQERFIHLWETILKRYRRSSVTTLFELLNEVVLPETTPWNELARRTVERLREIDSEAWILIGSNENNAVSQLKHLDVLNDSHIFYSFHSYEPLLFTHQKAHWVTAAVEYGRSVKYGDTFPNLAEFLEANPDITTVSPWIQDRPINRAMLEEFHQPVSQWIEEHKRPLYCGEFGVIDRVPAEDRAAWLKDMVELFDDLGCGWAFWTYKEMDFGLVDANGQLKDPLALKALMGR